VFGELHSWRYDDSFTPRHRFGDDNAEILGMTGQYEEVSAVEGGPAAIWWKRAQ
jgi:hypothetical protein